MSGFGVAPEVWVGAGKGVTEVADDSKRGVDAFRRAMGGQPFGSDDLGRALFEGDAGSGAPGFAVLRDGLLKDLAAAVNLLQGMGAGLVQAGGWYVEADGTIVDELGVQRRPVPSPGAPVGLTEYRLPEVAGGLPSTVPAPGFVREAQWFFETVGLGCPWPDGDISGVEALRDAALAMGRVLGHVAEMVTGHARRVTGSGFGEATAAFGTAARVVHGEGGLLEDLKRRCEQLAEYCQSGAAAIVKARWHFAASAVFVLGLIYAASVFGPLLEAAVAPLIRLEGLALQTILRIVIRNTTSADAPPAAPLKGDGGPYRYEMIFAGATHRAYADTMAELVDALGPGYASLPTDRERDNVRVRLAVDAQVRMQAEVATGGRLRDCTDDERAVILGARHEPPSPATWNAPVPLVLVTSFYRPYGALPRPARPADRQIWLDPGDDRSLLTTLHAAGFVRVCVRSSWPES